MDDMPISTTIWFRPHGTSGAVSVTVESVNPENLDSVACEIWDGLNKSFHMLSTRPVAE